MCTKNLKPGKDDGDKSFKSDHLIHGGQQLHVVLSMLFNTMLIYGYTPSFLLKSTILSIPKDYKPSLSSRDNYRGISLFNYKLNDNVISHLFRKELTASEMQFGFKEHHSTTLCSLIFTEVIST